jgi:hypothetical protein
MMKARFVSLVIILGVLSSIAMFVGGLPWGGHALH